MEGKNSDPLSPDNTIPVKVYVTAPATLPAGYTFDATVQGFDNDTFPVEVPEGGVVEGQEFLVPLPEDFKGERIDSPTGRWKDGLFGCFNYGICHPSLCCALWCTPLAMAQIMTRMSLTFLGSPGSREGTKNTFKIVAVLFFSYTIYSMALEIAAPTPDTDDDLPVNPWVAFLKAAGSLIFTLYSLFALMKTREFIRGKYSIPEQRLGTCEDFVLSAVCSCCTVAQMARHTGEYEKYNGSCFSSRGLPDNAPMNV